MTYTFFMEYLTLYEKFPAGAENTQTWKNYYLDDAYPRRPGSGEGRPGDAAAPPGFPYLF